PELVEGRADTLPHWDRLKPFVAPQGDLFPVRLPARGEELDAPLRDLLVWAEDDPLAVGVAVGRLGDDEAAVVEQVGDPQLFQWGEREHVEVRAVAGAGDQPGRGRPVRREGVKPPAPAALQLLEPPGPPRAAGADEEDVDVFDRGRRNPLQAAGVADRDVTG